MEVQTIQEKFKTIYREVHTIKIWSIWMTKMKYTDHANNLGSFRS